MSDYPRLIHLSEDAKARLLSYIKQEIFNHEAERSTWQDNLIRWQKEYWATPITDKATFPFSGAATIVIPLGAIAVEAIHARNMTTLFAMSQFISVKALHDEYADTQDPLEQYLDREFVQGMHIKKSLVSPSLEFIKFGTAVGKAGYEKIVKTAVRPTGVGDQEEEFQVITKQGAVVDGVALNQFIMPFSANDPQTAPWCGEFHSDSPYAVKVLTASKFFYADVMERLEAWVASSQAGNPVDTTRDFELSQARLEGRTAVWPQRIDWVEIWLPFDVDGSGQLREIVVHWHRQSEEFMSIRYNWHSDLRRPYRTEPYFPIEHRWTGLGVCKQVEQFQKEITTQHRQRLDNATLANVRMIKINKMAGYGPKEPIFPGKMWFVDNMDDMETIQMGEIYPSAYNNETATLQYEQQRVGINEQNLGMPQMGTPGTATSDLARIQEGNKKGDYTYGNFKAFVNSLVLDAVANIHQFGPRTSSYLSRGDKAAKLQQFFELPIEDITSQSCFEIVAAGQQQNQLLDRQNMQQISQMITLYYTNLLQLAQTTGNQELIALINQKAPVAATEAMKQILETFNIRKIDKVILSELLANAQSQPAGPGGIITPPPSAGISNASAFGSAY